jgi:hypothetical protein
MEFSFFFFSSLGLYSLQHETLSVCSLQKWNVTEKLKFGHVLSQEVRNETVKVHKRFENMSRCHHFRTKNYVTLTSHTIARVCQFHVVTGCRKLFLRGPLSLVSTIEELLERKSSGSGLESRVYGVGNRHADHVASSFCKSWH